MIFFFKARFFIFLKLNLYFILFQQETKTIKCLFSNKVGTKWERGKIQLRERNEEKGRKIKSKLKNKQTTTIE